MNILENKMAEIHYTISREIGPKRSGFDSKSKERAAKAVVSQHNISPETANKLVGDYCKSFNEEYIDESNPFKHADKVIKLVRDKAAVANLKGDKPKEEKYSKRLTKVMDYRNKLLAKESYESDKQLLDHHVTTAEPTVSNVNKMHDMVRNIAKSHGVSSNKIYDQVKNNNSAHQIFRDASTE